MSAALRAREALALARLGSALGVCLDPDKVNAQLLEELADVAESRPPDVHNPTRRLYTGEPFPVYGRHTSEARDAGICTLDLAYASEGEFGYSTTPSTEIFEDSLIDVARADLERMLTPAPTKKGKRW